MFQDAFPVSPTQDGVFASFPLLPNRAEALHLQLRDLLGHSRHADGQVLRHASRWLPQEANFTETPRCFITTARNPQVFRSLFNRNGKKWTRRPWMTSCPDKISSGLLRWFLKTVRTSADGNCCVLEFRCGCHMLGFVAMICVDQVILQCLGRYRCIMMDEDFIPLQLHCREQCFTRWFFGKNG